MNCPKCGAPNANGSPFCSACGTPLPAAPQQPQQYAQPQQQYAQPQQQYAQPQQYGQPQYQQPYGQQYARPRAPFQWFDARIPLVKRINRSALEALVAYFLCLFMPVMTMSYSGVSMDMNIFTCGAQEGKYIAMWILDIIFLLATIVVSVLGIHLGTTIGGGCIFVIALITLIFSGVDTGKTSGMAHVGIGAIFMLIISLAIIGFGLWEFLKFQKKQKMGR